VGCGEEPHPAQRSQQKYCEKAALGNLLRVVMFIRHATRNAVATDESEHHKIKAQIGELG
jgi:hypothetical protein